MIPNQMLLQLSKMLATRKQKGSRTNDADATGYCKICALLLNSQVNIVQMKEMNPPRIA